MIVYESDVQGFRNDVLTNRIEELILARFVVQWGGKVSPAEQRAWKNSLVHMDRVLADPGIPGDAGVAVEFGIPGSAKRMDFVLTGFDANQRKAAIIVELKQWEEVSRTTKDAIVETRIGGGLRETSHPSYQAWSYASLLHDFNEAVRDLPIDLRPCAYLHNCDRTEVIHHPFYEVHCQRAPAFLKDDAARLREFIKRHVRFGDARSVIFEILNGRIRPSKNLADNLVSLIQGNPEFTLIDDQKIVFETALHLAAKARSGAKQVLIVQGGPGTGKTVVAINVLVRLIQARLNARYLTKNRAPRHVYEAKLKGHLRKSAVSNLFAGPDSLHETTFDTFDALIVDEAHRLRLKSGMFGNLGENQIREAIRAARFTVFFVDDAQRVTLHDIGTKNAIREWAAQEGAVVTDAELMSQFRCNGSDGFLGWVDHTLGVRATANETLEGVAYDFRVCDSPEQLRTLIEERNLKANKARIVAGYCWKWRSRKDRSLPDIVIPNTDFSAQWNLEEDGGTWILQKDSVKQVGCIHTCQGLEVDYIGVILGHDFVVRKGRWVAFPERRDRADSTLKGYGRKLLEDRASGERQIHEVIRNTYRALMTRGSRGCYVWSVDPETNAYLREAMGHTSSEIPGYVPTDNVVPPIHPFSTIPEKELATTPNRIRLFFDLKAAAGAFTYSTSNEFVWIPLPELYRPSEDLFVVQVRGESMNRRIPNGSWCLFRANPQGSRQGKIVLARHRSIHDPDNGGEYTVKRYRSEKKINEEGWTHERVRLFPESVDPSFKELEIPSDSADDFQILAEYLAILE
jgi:uncharacterized protein